MLKKNWTDGLICTYCIGMTKRVSPDWVQNHTSSCEAISRLLHPYAEVVLHDLASDLIVAIWNPLSGRKVGDPALLSEIAGDKPDLDVYGPYGKVLPDGRNLTSVSSIIRDAKGVPCGLLCVNLDRSPLDSVVNMLSQFIAPVSARPSELFNRDWREQIALVIDNECRTRHLRRDRLTRDDRISIVKELDKQGLFSTRQAANHVAMALDISRATIYLLRKEARK